MGADSLQCGLADVPAESDTKQQPADGPSSVVAGTAYGSDVLGLVLQCLNGAFTEQSRAAVALADTAAITQRIYGLNSVRSFRPVGSVTVGLERE